MRACFAEGLGTFCLVFAGAGAIVVNDISGNAVTHLGIAITFGLIVFAMIASFGHVSGAHINPAVSIAFATNGNITPRQCAAYIFSQIMGALAASLVLLAMFAEHPTLGATLPAGAVMQSFALEVLLTFVLMLVIMQTALRKGANQLQIALAVGATVGLEALFAGPICGASMNPARSLGPAIASNTLEHLWLYLTAPIIGAALAVPAHRMLKENDAADAQSNRVDAEKQGEKQSV